MSSSVSNLRRAHTHKQTRTHARAYARVLVVCNPLDATRTVVVVVLDMIEVFEQKKYELSWNIPNKLEFRSLRQILSNHKYTYMLCDVWHSVSDKI